VILKKYVGKTSVNRERKGKPMPGEVDPRLIGFLQGVLGFADAMRDAGSVGDVSVVLGREDGLTLLKLVAGSDDANTEASSQRGGPRHHVRNSLRIASLTFEWPMENAARRRPEASRMFSTVPRSVGAAANENSPNIADMRFFGFDEDAPALR
jgi:hypothetical protein